MKKYNLVVTTKFKKDLKRIIKRGYDVQLLNNIVDTLQSGEQLHERYRDHQLTGNYGKYRECHIQPDWLLIYRIQDDVLILTLIDTGSHSDLF